MNIRKELEKYQSIKCNIEVFKDRRREIEEECMPNNIQTLSHTPIVHSNESKVEKTVIKIEEKTKLLDKLIREKESKIKILDMLIDTLNYKERIIVNKRVKDRKTFEDIYKEMPEEYSDYRGVWRAYDKAVVKMIVNFNGCDKLHTN